MHLNHPETIPLPPPQVCGKTVFLKLVPGAKQVGDHCLIQNPVITFKTSPSIIQDCHLPILRSLTQPYLQSAFCHINEYVGRVVI